jgi:hypothetical protein
MENKMDENVYQMEKKMNEMHKSMDSIESMLLQRIPKMDMEIQGDNENKENNGVETPSLTGVFYHNWREKIQNLRIMSIHHFKMHIIKDSSQHQGFKSKSRNYFTPHINVRKFYGKDPITCIFHMEKYFDINQVTSLQKVPISSLYLENDQFVWYQWICEKQNFYCLLVHFYG